MAGEQVDQRDAGVAVGARHRRLHATLHGRMSIHRNCINILMRRTRSVGFVEEAGHGPPPHPWGGWGAGAQSGPLKKHETAPVWQAGPAGFTRSSTVSASQSSRVSTTSILLPDVAPFS